MNRLNKESHVVEEINGIRCSIVEKNCPPERVEFLKNLLEYNGFTVVVAQTPAPAPKPVPKPIHDTDAQSLSPPPMPQSPSTFTVGVTNISFHAMLAVYERSLYRPDGKVVSVAYWNEEPEKEGELYWERRKKIVN